MRIFLHPPAGLSRAMARVSGALEYYAPSGIEVVKDPETANHVILHVVGYQDTVGAVEQLKAEGRTYSIIQYCLRTTQKPLTSEWLEIWRGARQVWSYYDLPTLAAEDGCDLGKVNFYYAGLGVNSDVFRPRQTPKQFTIFTSGYVAETETVAESTAAVQRVGGRQFHLGPDMQLGTYGESDLDIDDLTLSHRYSSSQFVAGLRREEGFELPAAEGLLCGARPIVYDRPHYRKWFNGFAVFIQEGSFEQVTDQLAQLFAQGPQPVTPAERGFAIENFNWETIARGFWSTF